MSKEELIKYFDNLIGGFNTDSWEKGSEADYINQTYNYMCKIEQENKQLKEQMAEIVKYKELASCSTATQYMAKENVYKVYDTHIKQLKERVEYLERSNNRREEEIIYLRNEQQLDLYKEVIEEVREYNNQIIKDTKDFYRPTEDVIYSGDTLIDLAETNIQILDKAKENK